MIPCLFDVSRLREDAAFIRDVAIGTLFLSCSWRLTFGKLRIVSVTRSVQSESAGGFPAFACRMSNLDCQYFSCRIFLSGPNGQSQAISIWKTTGEPSFRLLPVHSSSESVALHDLFHPNRFSVIVYAPFAEPLSLLYGRRLGSLDLNYRRPTRLL